MSGILNLGGNAGSSSSSVLDAYRSEFRLRASKAQFSDEQSQLPLQTPSKWFNVSPVSSPYTLAAKVIFNYTVTATAAVAPNAGTDTLSPFFTNGILEIGPAKDTEPRSQVLTREFAEAIEKFTYDINYGYPRPALPTFTAAGATTVTSSIYLPIGGEAAAMRLIPNPAPSNLYATPADVTFAINYIKLYVVDGMNDTVFAYKDTTTPALGTGLQSIRDYFSKNIQPDVIFMLGETTSTVTQIFATALDKKTLYNTTDMSVVADGALALTPNTGADPFALDITALGEGFRTIQVNYANATTHRLGFYQLSGGQVVNSPMEAAPTESTPAVTSVGAVGPAGNVVPSGSAAGGAIHAGLVPPRIRPRGGVVG